MRYLLSILFLFGIVFAQDSTCDDKKMTAEKKIEVRKEIKDGKVLLTITENGETEVHEFDMSDEEAIARVEAKLHNVDEGDHKKIKIIKKIKDHDCDAENCDPKMCKHAVNDDMKKMKIVKKHKMPMGHMQMMEKSGYLGVQIQDLSDQLADHFKVKDGGVLVSEVVEDSPADKSGFKAGDIVTKVDNKFVKNAGQLTGAVRSYKPESKVTISVIRDGKKKQLKATLGETENTFLHNFGNFDNFDDEHKMLFKVGVEDGKDFEFHSFPFDKDELKEDLEELREELKEMKEELKRLKEKK